MKHGQLMPHAEQIVDLFRPACDRIEIAGSLRRQQEDCRDIEILAIPIRATNLLGEMDGEASPALETTISQAILSGALTWDMQVGRNGDRHKRLMTQVSHPQNSGHPLTASVAIDLFLCFPENWGCQLMIRTGCAEFSQAMVTPALKCGLRQADGFLWRGKEKLVIPEEQTYFGALRMPFIEPCYRNEAAARQIVGG